MDDDKLWELYDTLDIRSRYVVQYSYVKDKARWKQVSWQD